MKISVEFDTNNAAFDENPSMEIRDVLNQAAAKAFQILTEGGGVSCAGEARLRDTNGNTVGTVKVEEDR
jgi:hypothetical protein